MKEADYADGQVQLLALAHIVRDLPLRDMIGAMGRAETIGPIADPTLFRNAAPSMRTIRKLAEALLPFQVEIERQTVNGLLRLEEEIEGS